MGPERARPDRNPQPPNMRSDRKIGHLCTRTAHSPDSQPAAERQAAEKQAAEKQAAVKLAAERQAVAKPAADWARSHNSGATRAEPMFRSPAAHNPADCSSAEKIPVDRNSAAHNSAEKSPADCSSADRSLVDCSPAAHIPADRSSAARNSADRNSAAHIPTAGKPVVGIAGRAVVATSYRTATFAADSSSSSALERSRCRVCGRPPRTRVGSNFPSTTANGPRRPRSPLCSTRTGLSPATDNGSEVARAEGCPATLDTDRR